MTQSTNGRDLSKNRLYKSAKWYLNRGFSIIPLKAHSKEPLKTWSEYQERLPTEQELNEWWMQCPDANIGIVTGRVSGICVLEVDDEDALNGKHIPITPQAVSGGKESPHIYFRYPEAGMNNYKCHEHGNERFSIRGDGQYVVAPPSIHPSGKVYKWVNERKIYEVELEEPPDWILELTSRKIEANFRNDNGFELSSASWESKKEMLIKVISQYWNEGQRQELAMCLAGYLAKMRIPWSETQDLILEIAQLCHDNEIRQRLASIKSTYDRESNGEKIKGFSGLKEILNPDDLQRLSDIFSPIKAYEKKDFFIDKKPKIHPSIDVIDGRLIYGIASGKEPVFISDRNILQLDEIKSIRNLEDDPQQTNFSKDGIQKYLQGETINPIQLYDTIRALLLRHVIFSDEWQADLTAIWIMGTYVYRCFPLYPYFWIKSPTKRCGKTTLLELMSALCFNANGVETSPSEAVLYRLPAITGGTLLWDEAENLIRQKEKGDFISILNTAYRRGGTVSRCVGKDYKVKFFEVYRPIAIAGISSLPDTVADRSLKTELIRKRRDEKVTRLQVDRQHDKFQKIRDSLYIFALDYAGTIIEAFDDFDRSLIPDAVDDRLRDAFEVMMSIASPILYSDANHPVLSQLQKAVRELSGVRSFDEEDSYFIRAVNILKSELDQIIHEKLILTSEEAVKLFQDGGIDWVKEPKDARSMLRKLGLRSDSHRIGSTVMRGYKITKSMIEDLYCRYGGAYADAKSVQSVTN